MNHFEETSVRTANNHLLKNVAQNRTGDHVFQTVACNTLHVDLKLHLTDGIKNTLAKELVPFLQNEIQLHDFEFKNKVEITVRERCNSHIVQTVLSMKTCDLDTLANQIVERLITKDTGLTEKLIRAIRQKKNKRFKEVVNDE